MIVKSLNRISILGLVVLLWACTPKKNQLASQIEDLQTAENQNGETKKQLAELQEKYATDYPDDSVSQYYLENAAIYQHLTDNGEKAIELTRVYLGRYPDSENKQVLLINMAKSYESLGKPDSSLAYFEKAISNGVVPVGDMRVMGRVLRERIGDANNPDQAKDLMKYAGIVEQTMGPTEAIPYYERLYTDFPKTEYAPYAMMKHENILEDKRQIEEAKLLLNRIIEEYPDTRFAQDAQSMLDNDLLGKSAEEQLQILLNKQKQAQ
ncbi:MAG: tetratricopeptide repeat protein [Bacteroidia bacterium]|nr:tetratricopeptide repeat protein [Bacteroidia bacterium]